MITAVHACSVRWQAVNSLALLLCPTRANGEACGGCLDLSALAGNAQHSRSLQRRLHIQHSKMQ